MNSDMSCTPSPFVKLLLRCLRAAVEPKRMGAVFTLEMEYCSGSFLGDVWFTVFIFVRSVIDG